MVVVVVVQICGKRGTQERVWPQERSSVFHIFAPAAAGVSIKNIFVREPGALRGLIGTILQGCAGRIIGFVKKREAPPWAYRRTDRDFSISIAVIPRYAVTAPSVPSRRYLPACAGRVFSGGRCARQFFFLLRTAPEEILFVDPHAVQNNGKLARHSDAGFVEAAPFGDLDAPGSQG